MDKNSRDVSGKEIAIYHSNDLYQWNVWGTDNVGKITANGAKFFYLKDHLGTIRVVLDASNNIVSANDYDCWGYPLENRSYQSNNTDYKFTGKQRDKESGYDYFGARYYDARIANFVSTDPLFYKFSSWSSYQYTLRNPLILVDPNGKYVRLADNDDSRDRQLNILKRLFDPKYADYISYRQNDKGEYFLDEKKLNEAGIDNNEIYTMLLNLAENKEQITSISIMKGDVDFWYNNEGKLSVMNLGTGFKGNPLYGHTYLLGDKNVITQEKPLYTSQNGENVICINADYGNEEAVVTLAHEIVHVYKYVNGNNWSDQNPFVVAKINTIMNLARESYKKW